jgi:RNA polymerase sigma factor (sigma-70 family)
MSTVAASRHGNASPERSPEWRERAGRLYEQLRRPARAMVRRAFRGAFDDDEIDDVYSNAWLGTLRALEGRHGELSDEEIRKYVLTAVANHASKELRRRTRRPTAPLDAVHSIPDDRTLPDERVAKREQSRIARDLLATLPPRRRAVMLLRYGWGLEPRQICGLVKGLSHRAYRKEITRGVDELAKKMRLLERGQWCADREPVLKAFAAGLADAEQERQARQHLSHCRHCLEFVGKLSGHLHDMGSSVALVGGMDAIADGRLSILDRMSEVVHRVRESAGSTLAGEPGDGAQDVATRVMSLPGGARGAGAAGAGALAKLTGIGAAGKLAAVCLGGGAAVTACVAAGLVPAGLHGRQASTAPNRPAAERSAIDPPAAPFGSLPSEGGDDAAHPPPAAAYGEPADGPEPQPEPDPQPPAPIAPSTPSPEQEFGAASVASSPAVAKSLPSSGGGSAAQREFGP